MNIPIMLDKKAPINLKKVKNVSNLNCVHTLSLCEMDNIKNVFNLNTVYLLKLICLNIKNLSNLNYVHSLILDELFFIILLSEM